MTKQELKTVKRLMNMANKVKLKLEKDRDNLRSICDDLSDILISLDTGVDEVESGLNSIQEGLDTMSQYI